MRDIEDDIVPFGFIDDASDMIDQLEQKNDNDWAIEYDPNF
jgi:hypothetical protein